MKTTLAPELEDIITEAVAENRKNKLGHWQCVWHVDSTTPSLPSKTTPTSQIPPSQRKNVKLPYVRCRDGLIRGFDVTARGAMVAAGIFREQMIHQRNYPVRKVKGKGWVCKSSPESRAAIMEDVARTLTRHGGHLSMQYEISVDFGKKKKKSKGSGVTCSIVRPQQYTAFDCDGKPLATIREHLPNEKVGASKDKPKQEWSIGYTVDKKKVTRVTVKDGKKVKKVFKR